MKQFVMSGQIAQSELICPEGGSEWVSASTLLAGSSPRLTAGAPATNLRVAGGRALASAQEQVPVAYHQNPTMPRPAASCGLATASLTCGLSSLLLGPLTGIPAIITGHMAVAKIKKSGGVLQGHGMAIAGLVLGYILSALFLVIVALAGAGFAAGSAAVTAAQKATTQMTATAIESAVNSFVTEYGTMPAKGSSDTTLITSSDTNLLAVLLGLESTINKKSILFLSVKEAKVKSNGLVYDKGGRSIVGLFDPWGSGYNVRLDLDNDAKLNVNGDSLHGRRVAVWSNGPDRKAGTKDDIKTW
jgi:hypothetical protein